MSEPGEIGVSCPLPGGSERACITLAHGGGGRLMRELIEDFIAPRLRLAPGAVSVDAAALDPPPGPLAFTTDAYVVSPLEFPGGSIGTLAIHGTINDLAAAGARARWLSVGLILEEGLSLEVLGRVLEAMGTAAAEAGVSLVTGDTKVVERGSADGMFVTTAGVGAQLLPEPPGPRRLQPGDALLLSGDIGRHGATIVAARESLGLSSARLASDSAPLHGQLEALADAGITVHGARDLTRGGLASAVIELCRDAGLAATLQAPSIPVEDEVRAVCELLGLDPLYLANEGRMLWIVPGDEAERAAAVLVDAGAQPSLCGRLHAGHAGEVTLVTRYGTRRALDLLSGDQLPRIC